MGETSIKKLGKSIIITLCVYLINLARKLKKKKIQRCPYLFFVLSTSLVGDSIIHCKCVNGTVYFLGSILLEEFFK